MFISDQCKLDILVANAGFCTMEFQLTEDGLEWHLAGNHLGRLVVIGVVVSYSTSSNS